MAGQTKLIIITSDEKIIRQFSLNSTNNAQIIDLDSVKQTTSNQNTDDILLRLADLTKLPESHSNNNEVSKRSLDSSDQKTVKTARKSLDVTCVICGDRAIGFNYDVLSCASCKAFFRRCAKAKKEKIRCLRGKDQCSISHTIQQKCRKCRLERCLAAGMRKDFLQTDEQKQKKRKCLEDNRITTLQRSSTETQNTAQIESKPPSPDTIENLLTEMDRVINDLEEIIYEKLSEEDSRRIENLEKSFLSFFEFPKRQTPNAIDLSDRLSALTSWSNLVNQITLRYINFIRLNSEFEQLSLNDRIILTKYNIFPILPISKCYNYKHQYRCPFDSIEEEQTHYGIFNLLGASDLILDSFLNVVVSFVEITKQDPKLLSILLLILFFTPGLSMSEEQPPLNDALAVHRIQCNYTKLLWNYLLSESGELKACQRFNQFLTLIFQMQLATKIFRTFFRDQCSALDIVDQITPLMQSVLHIS